MHVRALDPYTAAPICWPAHPSTYLSIKGWVTTAGVLSLAQAVEPPRFGAILQSTVEHSFTQPNIMKPFSSVLKHKSPESTLWYEQEIAGSGGLRKNKKSQEKQIVSCGFDFFLAIRTGCLQLISAEATLGTKPRAWAEEGWPEMVMRVRCRGRAGRPTGPI